MRSSGRIYIEKINWPFLFELKGTPAEYKAGIDYAIAQGWLDLHESGVFVKLTEAGAALFPCRFCHGRSPLLRAKRKYSDRLEHYCW
jgi:hypothetical protein